MFLLFSISFLTRAWGVRQEAVAFHFTFGYNFFNKFKFENKNQFDFNNIKFDSRLLLQIKLTVIDRD